MAVFKIGDRVAVRQVGVGSVMGVNKNEAFGAGREFYEIRPDKQTSTIYIPTDINPADRGLRKVMSAKQARQVYEVLATRTAPVSDVEWRRALKERQKASEINDQAALVRDMQARVQIRRLSTQEKAYLEKAVDVLVEEMAEALGQSHEEVKQAVDRALQEGTALEKAPTPN
ncbi:MAG: hypothetical protein EB084_01925 [Proteobacteria bacterium]|nr:hypothetical protein [Pseudomonadota bacterium]